jgi:hypothetical protein
MRPIIVIAIAAAPTPRYPTAYLEMIQGSHWHRTTGSVSSRASSGHSRSCQLSSGAGARGLKNGLASMMPTCQHAGESRPFDWRP